MLRKVFFLTLILLFALPVAHADEASKRAKIDELFTVMKMNDLLDQVMSSGLKQGEEMGKAMFGDKTPSAADQKILDSYLGKVQTLITNTLSWEKLKPGYIDLYAQTYTEAEVDGILAFYKSPSGIAMVQKTPELLTASQKLVMGRMQDVGAQLQGLLKDAADQIAAHKDDKSPAP